MGGETRTHSARTDDGVAIHVEETGAGIPIVFLHEFSGDAGSWEPQVRFLGRRYRCVAFNARGYPPSEVPEDPGAYSQQRAVADVLTVLDRLGIDRAHLVGSSMGAFSALHIGLRHPDRARSLFLSGCGYGSAPEGREAFRRDCEAIAAAFEKEGFAPVAQRYAAGPARVQYRSKDPRGWAEAADRLATGSATGAALTVLGVQRERPSLHGLADELRGLSVPTMIVAGDEDDGLLETNLMLKRAIPTAALSLFPGTGHICNLEEPDLFNRTLADFLAAVDAGAWRGRDPLSPAALRAGAYATALSAMAGTDDEPTPSGDA
jgi:pimeloyl-ACP methyl ester carboxylesterase